MSLVALAFAVIAVACFLWASRRRVPSPSQVDLIAFGLAAFVAAFTAQQVWAGGWHWIIR